MHNKRTVRFSIANNQRHEILSTIRVICIITVFGFSVSGCVNTTVQEVREARTGLSADQSIVILSRKHKTRDETENKFTDCVSEKTGTGEQSLAVMPEQEFVDHLFPWFEPRTAPLNLEDLEGIIERPLIAERIQKIGVRYLVWIEGTTQRSDQAGSVQCTVVSGGVPACFGFLSWESGSNYEASIWDITKGINVGKVNSEASGTSFVPAVVVPLPFIARVQAQACNTLSEQLKTFIGA